MKLANTPNPMSVVPKQSEFPTSKTTQSSQ